MSIRTESDLITKMLIKIFYMSTVLGCWVHVTLFRRRWPWPRWWVMWVRVQWSTCTVMTLSPSTSLNSTPDCRWSTPAQRWLLMSTCLPPNYRFIRFVCGKFMFYFIVETQCITFGCKSASWYLDHALSSCINSPVSSNFAYTGLILHAVKIWVSSMFTLCVRLKLNACMMSGV